MTQDNIISIRLIKLRLFYILNGHINKKVLEGGQYKTRSARILYL